MSQDPHSGNNVAHAGTGDQRYPPQGASTFIDGSGPIFSMYLDRAKEEDEKLAESWKADADGILIFTGLFSASVAALISVSIQDVRLNPQDTSNFYLANIYEAIADPNRANISAPSSPPPFSPPNYAVWVNTLWFLSLVISITCALLATLLQQWARRYLKVTQPHSSLDKRARTRAFFAEGVDKSVLPWVVEALPTLLHLSLLLFFVGLVVFLWNVHLTIFKFVLSWVCVCSALYGCTTIVPFFRHDSPFYTPLTPLARPIAVVTLKVFIKLRTYLSPLVRSCTSYFPHSGGFCCSAFRRISRNEHRDWLGVVQKLISIKPEEAALKSPSEIITRAFMWTFDSLDEDQELDLFFSSLPSFCSSKVVKDPLPNLERMEKEKLFGTLARFLHLTFSSTLLPEPVKVQRAIMCAKVLDLAKFPQGPAHHLYRTVFRACNRNPRTTTSGPHSHDIRDENHVCAQAIFTAVVSRPRQRDDSWFSQVAPNALGIPEAVLRDYAATGDNLSLAIFIHVIRQQFTYLQYSYWPKYDFWDVLERISKFDIQKTSPELQHEFCELWNQIVLKAQNDDNRDITRWILRQIRDIYITLHRDTDSAPKLFSATTSGWANILDAPSSYPVCEIPGHVHDNSASTTFSRTVLHNVPAQVPASLSGLNAPSLSVPALRHAAESSADVPSSDPSHSVQTTIDPRIPVTSADLFTASVRDVDTSGITTMPHPSPEISTSAPLYSGLPPAAVALRHNANPLAPSGLLNLSSSASSHLVLGNMLPTESHPPVVTTPPGASPGTTFTPDSGAAASPNDMV